MRALFIFLLFAAGAANAQDVQKALIQRDQQSDAFALQVRQSQEVLKVSPASRVTLETRQLWDRQRLDTVGEQQLIEPRRDRAVLGVERRPFTYPIVEVPLKRPAPPPPLQPSLKGNVDLIEAPR